LQIVSNANPVGGIKAKDNAAFGAPPQGSGLSIRRLEGLAAADPACPRSKILFSFRADQSRELSNQNRAKSSDFQRPFRGFAPGSTAGQDSCPIPLPR